MSSTSQFSLIDWTRLVYASLVLACETVSIDYITLDESFNVNMISHGSPILCPHSIVLAGDMVSIERHDIERASRKASCHRRHSLARLIGLALSMLRWF